MRVKAIQKMYYNRRDRMPGEEYDMDDREASEANILSALGKIEIINKPKVDLPTTQRISQAPVEAPSEPPAQAMTTEDSALVSPQTNERPPRRYRRRDMRPQQ